ncbi:MAG TPA: hypothetical protein ENJ18_06410 [Nannocystis exedens]|nr:hypothetical protein [Nannocystis exedens]
MASKNRSATGHRRDLEAGGKAGLEFATGGAQESGGVLDLGERTCGANRGFEVATGLDLGGGTRDRGLGCAA